MDSELVTMHAPYADGLCCMEHARERINALMRLGRSLAEAYCGDDWADGCQPCQAGDAVAECPALAMRRAIGGWDAD